MRLRYGGYLFDVNGVEISRQRDLLRDGNGTPTGYRMQWTVSGDLLGSGQADLAARVAQLERALSLQGQDLYFLRDDGGVAMALTNAASTSGVLITSYSDGGDPVGRGWVNGNRFSFTAEASYVQPAATGAGPLNLFDLQERVALFGGGPKRGHMQPTRGKPIPQVIFEQTPYRASQAGSATGPLPYPTPVPPLWPAAENRDARRVEFVPKRDPQGIRVYETTWSYEFESADRLSGLPHPLAG